ncbi:hypothetical protein Tsp_09304 [Trichinella spiralis]|uniref:hypothetical protein n=1 Tax=Trichinella spiralis TaxID=6334 RepID=UPI0001EFC746|nr:hypothetical protein Tsp_09304 [Trichinella spiralis]
MQIKLHLDCQCAAALQRGERLRAESFRNFYLQLKKILLALRQQTETDNESTMISGNYLNANDLLDFGSCHVDLKTVEILTFVEAYAAKICIPHSKFDNNTKLNIYIYSSVDKRGGFVMDMIVKAINVRKEKNRAGANSKNTYRDCGAV